MLDKIIRALSGSQHERDLKALLPMLHAINSKETWAASMPAEEFPIMTAKFRERFASGEGFEKILPEAFALAREAAKRNLGERPYDVQVLGSIVLHQGKIAELKTGEGKTLMVVAAAYLNAIPGKGVHVVTVNDYLAERDANWMRPVFSYMGLTVGTILSNMDNERRRLNYACDITYGTNNEFGFDYLRDNMCRDMVSRVQRGHNYCIIDEIDSILIDEARTPLIISGAAEDDTFKFSEIDRLIGSLEEIRKKENGEYPDEVQGEEVIGHYKLNEKNKNVSFSNSGQAKIEELLTKRGLIKGSIVDEENFEYIHYFTQALRAHKLFHRDVDYVVQEGLVQIVDEFTGRILTGRRYSDGLHQAIEAKERIKIAQRNRTLATITFQNYFRLYSKIAGGTGTADTEAAEFGKIYKLEVVVIPTNLPVAREDEDDIIYLNEKEKFTALCDEISEAHARGQPILVGTASIEKSEKIDTFLTRRGIRHEVLNAKNHAREASIIAEAGAKGAVTIATNMAGRGTDIKLGGNPEHRARKRAGTEASEGQTPEAQAKYASIYKEEYEKWRKDYEEVKALGGLYVIGTERHESRRIDNQLRGRSGRQGDPGRSRFFISLEDDLMRLFGGENIKSLMTRVGMKEGEPIYHPWLNKSIAKAQRKVEERNFEIRKHLLEYDDVLNQQRKYIYEQRDAILKDSNLKERVNNATNDMMAMFLENFQESQKKDPSAALKDLTETLKTRFGYILKTEQSEIANMELLEKRVCAELRQDIDEKEAIIGEYLNLFIRDQYLAMVDKKWLDHLENMEALREAVYLRSYAQKNPLTEYKLEGFQIFDTMIDDIRQVIASRLHLVRIQTENRDMTRPQSVPTAQSATHSSMGSFGAAALAPPAGGGGQQQAPAGRMQGSSVTVVRNQPKVGRNDPCHCGSGKKFKHCHGR
ncbi:MAG: preprotein translocase subunit SecA [Treponema sp.]|jgi:preprotein translocase subunit SecA|nr:preprotein translocase subunit SecA [Treponema sp.]